MNRPILSGALILLTLLMVACSKPQLPEAKPLTASDGQLAQIPNISQGEYQVISNRDVRLIDPVRERELEISVFYPDRDGHFPLLYFSHGNWSNKDKYDAVINYWVSHGYVVIAPNHLDCCSMASGIFNSLRYGNFGLIENRVSDFNFLINHYAELEQALPALLGKADIKNIALVGHSFGAFTAQQFGGAGTYNTDDEQYHYYQDDRIKAIVAISPPGPMFDEITAQSWQQLSTPTFVSTGTWDVDSNFFPQYELHLMSYETALPNDKYALVIEGADHYLGNLICRPERDEAPQSDALMMLNASSTTFLHAYLKGDDKARDFLQSQQLNQLSADFARLSYK